MSARGGPALEGEDGSRAGATLVILNPKAGREGGALRRELANAFTARGAPYDLVLTECPGHATQLARAAVGRGYRAVCVVGGDGTIAEAAAGLVGADVPLGIVPRGTGNQVARNLGIPLALAAAVDVVLGGHARAIDLGEADGRAFALMAGAGLDAAVMAAATRELKERWGYTAYVYAALMQALQASPVRFRVVADERELEVSAVSVMVANVGALFAKYPPFPSPSAPAP